MHRVQRRWEASFLNLGQNTNSCLHSKHKMTNVCLSKTRSACPLLLFFILRTYYFRPKTRISSILGFFFLSLTSATTRNCWFTRQICMFEVLSGWVLLCEAMAETWCHGSGCCAVVFCLSSNHRADWMELHAVSAVFYCCGDGLKWCRWRMFVSCFCIKPLSSLLGL